MLLRHVLTNLLSNAIKYSHAGRPVRITLSRDGNRAIFTIADEGIGIPEEDQARLFSAFYRAANVGSRRGTGIGLVVVRRCVDLLGGEIRFQSKLGVGTTFTVSAPVFKV
jgi:signal transduction histidine kinase